MDKVLFRELECLEKWGRTKSSCWAPPSSKCLSKGLSPLTVNPVCSSVVIWKESKSVSTGQILHTGNKKEKAQQRSFILSMALHQNSDHIPFISDPATLLCLSSSSYSVPCSDLSLSIAENKTLSPLHWQWAHFFYEMLHWQSCSCKEQLGALCMKKELWHLKPIGIFKIKEGKTTHSSWSSVSSVYI